MASIPPVPATPPVQPAAPVAATPTGDAVEGSVTNLPPSLETTDRAITLRGEVQAQNEDGTVTIATPRGPVVVKLPEPVPAQGQRVEVTLPAGSPPTEATVRNVQTPPAQPQQPVPQVPATTTTPQPQAPTTTLPAVPLLQEENAAAPRPTPASAQTQTPSQQNTNAASTSPDADVSPQTLLNFLKSSLQSVLKSPDGTPAKLGDTLGAQRPLQIGQLVRLIPSAVQALATQTTTTPQIGQPTLGNQATPQLLPKLMQALAGIARPGVQGAIPQQAQGIPQTTIQSATVLQTLPGSPAAPGAQTTTPHPMDRILLPLMGSATSVAGTATTPAQTSIPAQSGGLAGMIKDMMFGIAAPRPGQVISTPAVPLPQMHAPMIDARMTATLPMISSAATQNPGMASLLHGTPTLPVLFVQIAGETAQGLPLIQMPVFNGDGPPKTVMMTLQFPARPMAPGTWVRMDVMQTGAPMSAVAAQPMAQATEWAALDDLITTLKTEPHGQATAALAQNALPKPGSAAFTAPVLMYLAAARGGDVTAWLGERVVDTVRNARRTDILARLTSALTSAAKQRDDTAPTIDWKTIQLPMLSNENQLAQIQLHYRSFERDGETPQEQKKTGTRFVLDLSLSRMGPVQVDGLSLGQQLDITLRSEQSFSPAMREALRLRYTDALGGIGFSGQLNFNADFAHKGWVDFHETPDQHARTRA